MRLQRARDNARWPRWLLTLGLALATLVAAPAVHAAPPEASSGDDLRAWRTLEAQRLAGSAAERAYRGFLVRWNDSPLALMAYERLTGLGVDPLDELRGRSRALALQVKRRHELQRKRLFSALDAASEDVADAAADDPAPRAAQ